MTGRIVVLWMLETNPIGRGFCDRCGSRPEGATRVASFGGFEVTERRYCLALRD